MDYNTESTDKSIQALSSLLKGCKKDSPVLQYVKKYDDDIDDITKTQFIEFFKNIIELIYDMKKKVNISASECNSLIHSNQWTPNFKIEMFKTFIDVCNKYADHLKEAEKFKKNKKYEKSTEENKLADDLNKDYDEDITKWLAGKRNGGSDSKGMSARLEIIKKRCCGAGSYVLEPEPDTEVAILPGGIPIPTATTL
tara:strand:- start:65 stop:655 length:591 start_codon:yes stop_codon:yes gene_type:complete